MRRVLASAAGRRLVSAGIVVGLVVVACGSPAAPQQSSNPQASLDAGQVGSTLPVGLLDNLDKLDSYQFTESIPRLSASASASVSASPSAAPTNSGPLTVSGTVVNRPSRALSINTHPSQFIVVGDEAWRSTDGITWSVGDPTDSILTDLLPGHDYPTWFDSKATYFHAAGEETKNEVPCIHYKGDTSLEGLYAGVAGTSVAFVADLWIAVDGQYPVSGTFGFAGSADSPAVSWGFSFEILNANGSSNGVSPPSNVVALPS